MSCHTLVHLKTTKLYHETKILWKYLQIISKVSARGENTSFEQVIKLKKGADILVVKKN